MNKALLTVMATIGALALGGFFAAAPAQAPVEMNDFGEGFDLQDCEQYCRSWFNVDPYGAVTPQRGGWGGSGRGYYAYASCIQECNRKYWKNFDKETEGTIK